MEHQLPSAFVSASQSIARATHEITLEHALEILRRDGVLVIENVLSPAQLQALRVELYPWFDAASRGRGQFFGRGTKRFSGLFAKARSTADLALHPLVLSLMDMIFRVPDAAKPICDVIELNLTQAIGIEPGEPAQFLHRDDDLWAFPRNFELMTNAMWTLDDFTIRNGATRLVPGSHLWARDRAPQPGDAISAEAPAGSVILWLGSLLHAGGANQSDRIRRGVVMSYRLAWLASSEKLLLSTPPELARTLPERLQQLIGYQLHKPNLGWVEGQDPIRWLRGEFVELAEAEDNLTSFYEDLLAMVAKDPQTFAGYLT